MGFLDKAKAAAETAVAKTKEGVEDVQTKRELGQAYDDLGKTAFGLIESGELSHPKLEETAAKIRELKARDEGDKPDDAPETETVPEAAAAVAAETEPVEDPV